MARGITYEGEYHGGSYCLTIRKSRGKLTVQEIGELLLRENGGRLNGRYVIFLNATEGACEGSGWDDGIEPKGDAVTLIELDAGEQCPVCCKLLPEPDYCPHCGGSLRKTD